MGLQNKYSFQKSQEKGMTTSCIEIFKALHKQSIHASSLETHHGGSVWIVRVARPTDDPSSLMIGSFPHDEQAARRFSA